MFGGWNRVCDGCLPAIECDRADALRLMVDLNRTRRGAAAARPPGRRASRSDHEVEMAEAAFEVSRTLVAVTTARDLTAEAAAHSLDDRMIAGRTAEKLVADTAAQNAVETQARADIAATRVSEAARRAAAFERGSAGSGEPGRLERAARTAATVEAAAVVVAAETAALASLVAQAEATTAEWMAITRQTLDRVIAAEVASTAAAVELRATATAHQAADDVAVRVALDQTKTEFLATVIHELRTPMANITGYTELLQESEVTVEQRKHLDAIQRNAIRLQALADDLLTLSSLEDAAVSHDHTALDMREVVTSELSGLQTLTESRRLDVTLDAPSGPVMVHGEVRSLERLVSNLVSNAVKFTQDGGWIHCALQDKDGWALLEVSDNGIGIPEAEQPHLFTRFFRSSTALNSRISGSGLGLTIVESIIKRHGGTISVTSAHQRGTTFIVKLPLWTTEAE